VLLQAVVELLLLVLGGVFLICRDCCPTLLAASLLVRTERSHGVKPAQVALYRQGSTATPICRATSVLLKVSAERPAGAVDRCE
jgi:hypothetical protein